jgi:hypothetical protein
MAPLPEAQVPDAPVVSKTTRHPGRVSAYFKCMSFLTDLTHSTSIAADFALVP